jgi:hypothetical protein
VVNQRAARGVDERGAGRQRGQLGGADHVPGLRQVGRVQAEHVGPGQGIGQGDELGTGRGDGGRGGVRVHHQHPGSAGQLE